MVKSIMWEFFVPRVLLFVSIPVLPTAALSVLVHPSWAIVTFTPCLVPTFSVFAFPPCLSLFYPVTLCIKMFVPFVTPFSPALALTTLSPFISVFCAAALPIILLAPPAKSCRYTYFKIIDAALDWVVWINIVKSASLGSSRHNNTITSTKIISTELTTWI